VLSKVRYAVQGRRGGKWVTVPGEGNHPTRAVALQRMTVFAKLIIDAEWRVIRVRDLARGEEV
jgi:hypothetical protein